MALMEYGVINLVLDSLRDGKFFVGILCDFVSLSFPLVCTALYTTLSFLPAQVLGSVPFLMMIFFSTTFSPGSGVDFFNYFRYLFPRFYFWCLIPGVGQLMEGCPTQYTILYMILTAFVNVFLFSVIKSIFIMASRRKYRQTMADRKKRMLRETFIELQTELFGPKVRKRNDIDKDVVRLP